MTNFEPTVPSTIAPTPNPESTIHVSEEVRALFLTGAITDQSTFSDLPSITAASLTANLDEARAEVEAELDRLDRIKSYEANDKFYALAAKFSRVDPEGFRAMLNSK